MGVGGVSDHRPQDISWWMCWWMHWWRCWLGCSLMQWWMVWWMPLGVMECSPEPVPGWAKAGATDIATITIIRATIVNNATMRLFMCCTFPKGRADQPRQLANRLSM
jgi:hypothetical protein